MPGERVRRPSIRSSKASSKVLSENALVIAAVSFLLTGVLGTGITYLWSYLQWRYEQKALVEREALARRYATSEEVITAIAATCAPASDLAQAGFWSWDPTQRSQEIKERRTAWETSSRTWRVQSRVLRQRLALHFMDSNSAETFSEIIATRRRLGQLVRALIEEYEGSPSVLKTGGVDCQGSSDWDSKQRTKAISSCINELVNEIDDQANELAIALRQGLSSTR